MEFLKRFWKPRKSLRELTEEYKNLTIKNEVYSNLYQDAKQTGDLDREIEATENLLKNAIAQIETMIVICEHFCPTTAKTLRNILGNFRKMPHHDFRAEKKKLERKYKFLTGEQRDEIIRDGIENALTFLRIHNQNVELVSSSIFETMKTLERPYVLQKSEYLESELKKLKSDFSLLYQSAWNSLESDNRDRFRQCCSTLRKLLDSIIDEKGEGKNREEKLSFILRNQDEKFAKAFVNYIKAIFNLLGKCVHVEMDMNEVTFTFAMVEDALLYLSYVLSSEN